jgi:uncharacterized protein (UPF0332 family)
LHYADEAGRAAYLAGLHTAQALVFERTGKVTRSHRGVQRELYRLTAEDPGFDPDLRAFLGRSYNLKPIADYQTGAAAEVSADEARVALDVAARLVGYITTLLD